jgi:mRNA-degrading endonuclease toxin of MazEF toxin-antitoxin module
VSALRAGQIVLVDWRDGMPRESNKLRPAIVIEDERLFDPDYPNVIVVPLSGDARVASPSLALAIEPTPENGCTARCYALSCNVVTTSVRRVRATAACVEPGQLAEIRRQIVLAIGMN